MRFNVSSYNDVWPSEDYAAAEKDRLYRCLDRVLEENPKAKRGYSRDGRPDCLQVGGHHQRHQSGCG